MPEEFLQLLLGGVGWGFGLMFAGQGDTMFYPLNLLMSIILLTLRMLLTQKAEEHPQVELQELPHFINSDYSI